MSFSEKKIFSGLIFAILISVLIGSSQDASAALQTLIDENAVVVIEDGAGGSNAGVTTFTVDGVDNMVQDAWWYCRSFVGVPCTVETPVADLGVASAVATDEDSDGDDDKLVITFLQPDCFNFKLTYELTGGAPGSGLANLKETVQGGGVCGGFLNSFHYTDLNGAGSPVNTSNRPSVDVVTQGPAAALLVTTATYSAQQQAVELNLASDLLGRLNDGDADSFGNTAVGSGFGPGDGAYVAHYENSMLAVFPFGVPLLAVVDIDLQPASVTVPNVVGLDKNIALDDLSVALLRPGNITYEASSTIAAGRVISQNPTGGTVVNTGSPVDIVVSLGDGNLFKLSFTGHTTAIVDHNNLLVFGPGPLQGFLIYDANAADSNVSPTIGEFPYLASRFEIGGLVFDGRGPPDPCNPECLKTIVASLTSGFFQLFSENVQVGGPFISSGTGRFSIPLFDGDSGIFSNEMLPTTPFTVADLEFLSI